MSNEAVHFDAAGCQNGIFGSRLGGVAYGRVALGAPNLIDALSHDADILSQPQFEAR
jgi:hypothetical protein